MPPKSNPAIFFGSGPVAAKSLELLLDWLPIAAIVTKTTPAHHKEQAPVELIAKRRNIKLYYANNRSELDQIFIDPEFTVTNFGIVIDYGIIISQSVIDMFEFGIINSHFSLLPEWRGADPITFSLLSGQPTTGVSIMVIDAGLDTGELLAQATYKLGADTDNSSLSTELIKLSNDTLKQAIPKYLSKQLYPKPQASGLVTHSIKLNKASGIINPNLPASELARQIRAFSGWPNSRLFYNNLWLTITQATASTNSSVPKGELKVIDGQLIYGCQASSLVITELQPAGKNKMSAAAFINGYAHKILA